MSEEHLLVLLVDDEASLRTPLARYLSNMYAYHVDTAANEEEAWEHVLRAERPYDVALIDDLLTPKPGAEPEPIGIGLVARIRERCPETECIIFTGWGMDRALEALQAGAYRYLAKPLNLDELGMTIRMAVEQGRLRRERDLLSATLEISRAMLSELDVGKTLEVIAEAVPKLVGAEGCAVARVDQATDQVHHEPMILTGDATVRWHRHLKGVSLTRQIIETGQEFFLPDVDARADEVDENLHRAGVKSFIGLPIPNEPENWGVLYAYSSRREAFGTHERHVLQLLAGQAAIALENARLFEVETQRRREAETLRETALALTTTLKLREIFERILSELQKVVPYDSASVQLLTGDRLEIIGGCGFPNLPAILGLSFSVDGDNPSREVIRRRDWFIVPDALVVYEGFSKEPHVQAGIRGWLGVPMQVGDRPIGIIALDKRQPGFYTEKHARLAQTFAAQAAVAIENARLYDETQQRARRLETLQNLTFTISSSLDLDETLRKACQAAVEFFNADHSSLVLFDASYVEGKVRAEYPALGTSGTTIPLRGVPAEERLIETKEPLIISNVAGDESLGPIRDILGKFDIHSILIVPVVFKGRVLGSFSLDATGRFRTFMENEVDLCKIFAAQVAVAIENARLYRNMERQAERLRFLYEIGGELTSALEPDSILDSIAGHIVRLVGARKSLFLLVDKERGRLIKATGYGYPPEHLLGLTFEEVEAGVSGWVLRTGKPALVADAQGDLRNIGIALERARQFGTAPLIVAPLVVKEEVIGTLTALNVAGDPPFTEDDLNMVVMLANQAAIAIENARLYGRERRRASEAEAMVRVGQAISSTLDLDRILETVAKNALSMLGLEDGRSIILLVDEKTGDFVRSTRVPPRHDGNGPRRRGGLTSLVIETGEPIVIPDVRRDSRVRASVVEEGVRSLIGVPLKVKERTIGVLFANTLCPCDFTQHDIEMLSNLANQAAVAIENARLFSQLSETKERLNNLIASSLDAVISIDKGKKITVFNRRAEEMFGWTAKEMEGRSVARLYADFGKAQEIYKVVNREGTVVDWEILLSHKDGTRIPALLSATLIRDSQGNSIGQAGFIRDLRQVNLLVERLRAVIRVSQAITGTLELDKVLNLIVESTVAAFPTAQSGVIHLYDERADTLRVRAITLGYSAEALEVLSLRVGEGIAGWVFQNQQPLVVNDTGQDPRYRRVDHPGVRVHRSMICVPLWVRKQVIGTLSLNTDITGAFQPEDLGLLASFADQAAIAIDNARRMQELEQIRQAAEAMSRVFEPRQALRQIVESAAQILQVDSAVIWSYDEVRHSFIPEQLVAVGISPGELERFRKEEPKPGQTAETVMHEGYVTVMDISQPEYDFLGLSTRELLNRIGVRSFQGIVLKVGDERLGVLYANYNYTQTFDKDDEATLRTFASHAALALKNAHLMAQMQRARETAGVIAGVTLQENLAQTLKTIVQHTQQVLRSDAVSLYSYDEATGQFGEWATEIVDARDSYLAHRPEKLDPDSAVGTILRLEGPPYYHFAEDHADQDRLLAGAFVHAEGIQAASGIQLRVGEHKVGVMFVNFRSPHRFTSDEIATIQLFADQAAVAIENARAYEELKRIKGYIGSKTAADWMRMVSTAWGHSIRREVGTALGRIALLHRALARGGTIQEIEEEISQLENVIKGIKDIPIIAPLSYEDTVGSVQVNGLVKTHLEQQWKHARYKPVTLYLDLQVDLDKIATVRASREWLRRALDILTDNSVQAMLEANSSEKQLTVTTRLVGKAIEISVRDTGPGIPRGVLEKLFKEPIDKPMGSRGAGIGLMLAQTIAQTYGGNICVRSTGAQGTDMVITLPIEDELDA